ncbi:replication initiator [Streptomyces anulatus]|uniref:replication initiator n=1 Tax=Streptomyces anulatus TaxID=1892 RepID=UPI0034472D77
MALDVAVEVAKLNGVCIRPIELRRFDTHTGTSEPFDIPCGTTNEAKCPPCAKRNKQLRMAQCREGWHLDTEPVTTPHPATDDQKWLIEFRADVQAKHDAAERDGDEVADWDEAIAGIDAEINAAGMRGNVTGGRTAPRRSRSTRRRQDAPDLPKRARQDTTLGRTFIAADGTVFRPSLFVTLTLTSYGKIRSGQGVPVDPATYDYARAARDALHFSKLVDRFVQNLRRVAGYDVQYFATVEPQKRFAPHLHMAIRGTLPRAEIKQTAAATYHQVWWPSVDEVRFEGDHLPVWAERYEPCSPACANWLRYGIQPKNAKPGMTPGRC